MPEVSIQEIKTHYFKGDCLKNSRPTVLMIHGAAQSASTWKYQLDLFKNNPKFNLLVPSLPGRGGSEGSGFQTVIEYKNFLYELIESLELHDVILIGHSMGGGIAMLLAIEHPELIKGCVLAATGAKLTVAQQTLETVRNDYGAFCEISPQRMFAETSSEDLKQEFKQSLIDTGSQVCYGDLTACNNFDIMDDVDKISAPTLILSADKDILTPVKYGEFLHQRIYGSQFFIIKESGHFIMQEKEVEFNELVLQFLNDIIE